MDDRRASGRHFWQPSTKFLRQLDPAQNLQDLSGLAFVGRTKYGLAKRSGSVDGKVYTATFGFPSVFGLFYNKAVLARIGVAAPATAAELDTAMRKAKAAGVSPLQLAGGDAWTNQVPVYDLLTQAVGAGLIDRINRRQAIWSDPAVVAALTTFKSYVDAGLVNPDARTAKYTEQQAALLTGKAAFVAQGSWMAASLAETAGAGLAGRIGFIAWPGSAAVQWQTSNLGSIQLPKTGDSGREKAARDFVDYATGEGYAAYVKATGEPTVITGVDTPSNVSALTQTIVAAYQKSSTPSIDMQAAASFGDFPTLVGQLIAGTMSPAQVAAAMQKEFDRNAKLVKVPGF